MITWRQLGFQDANSPAIEEFIYFNDSVIVVIIFIISFVGLEIGSTIKNKLLNKNLLEIQVVECIWTLIPASILIGITTPSLFLLYISDDPSWAKHTVKIVGHQWFWTYEYTDYSEAKSSISLDSFILPSEDINEFRLLEVSNRIILPTHTNINALVSSSDVLHSWAVPSLGIKSDATPGRLNSSLFIGVRPGVFYGQCSEICGSNHSFIPIVIEFIRFKDFIYWLFSLNF